jgi:thermitase
VDDDGDGEVDEGFGHGTFVSGLVLGGAPGASILPVRVLDSDGRGEASDIAAGIEYAVAEGADVVNLSLGARQRSEVLRGAVRFALSRGVVVVASTGNGADLSTVDFPGGVTGVIAVTALDAGGARAPFANASLATALSAPGVDLIGPYPDERWGTWSGTSFSTALASAGTALLLERQPRLNPTQVRKKLMKKAKSVKRTVARSERKLMGGGRLDLSRLAK